MLYMYMYVCMYVTVSCCNLWGKYIKMKQIIQNAEVEFHSLEIQDVITVLPVMDKLAEEYHSCFKIWSKYKDSEQGYEKKRAEESFDQAMKIWDQLQVLHRVGFCMSNPGMVQPFEGITYSNED